MSMIAVANISQRVLRHPLFHPLDEIAQQRLLAAMREYRHPTETLLIRQGQAATHFFLVLEGRVKLFRISVDGQEKVVEIIQAGQTFAEAVMFMQHSVYPVFAETLAATHIVSIPNDLMLQVLSEHPKSCLHLLGHLSIRLHMRLGELETLTLQNATQRFALYLIQQLENRAAESADIDLMLPKHLIAARLSMQPETLSRLMARLRDEGLITITGRHIHIASVANLLARFNDGSHLPPSDS
jgi:CRP-like cAMP-binding protein